MKEGTYCSQLQCSMQYLCLPPDQCGTLNPDDCCSSAAIVSGNTCVPRQMRSFQLLPQIRSCDTCDREDGFVYPLLQSDGWNSNELVPLLRLAERYTACSERRHCAFGTMSGRMFAYKSMHGSHTLIHSTTRTRHCHQIQDRIISKARPSVLNPPDPLRK
jgi:hypothetical protein